MTQEFRVKGLSELQRFLDTLSSKVEANIIRGALRAAAKPIADEARQNAPVGEPSEIAKRKYKVYAGSLRDSIRVSGRIDARKGVVTAKVVAGGKSRKTGANVFHANFAEFGTRPHSLSRKNKGTMHHPGTSPKPFMRPAIDSKAGEAVVAAGEYIKRRLASKYGLDVSEINIGLEEE